MSLFFKFIRWLQIWSFRITDDYAIDIMLLHKYRSFSDGITFFKPEINLDLYEGDHSPKFEMNLAIMNVYVFQLEIYNVNHIKLTRHSL